MKSTSKKFREKVQNSGVNTKFESKIGASILAKYGWKEGDGLGKQGEGIVKPVTLNAVKNNKGLGAKEADPWHNWWDDMYNDLAKKSVKVKSVKTKKAKLNGESVSSKGVVSNGMNDNPMNGKYSSDSDLSSDSLTDPEDLKAGNCKADAGNLSDGEPSSSDSNELNDDAQHITEETDDLGRNMLSYGKKIANMSCARSAMIGGYSNRATYNSNRYRHHRRPIQRESSSSEQDDSKKSSSESDESSTSKTESSSSDSDETSSSSSSEGISSSEDGSDETSETSDDGDDSQSDDESEDSSSSSPLVHTNQRRYGHNKRCSHKEHCNKKAGF
ncbi:G-patch domain-containing protein [Babesia ovis]|uniref:G-patch domain-containing protein n=1 Tax=Babesia ovis TaxID=5869 RepID=A0A9W5TA04_BABOV|nr:G-patch domain-containing protein [Babesia ovis]